MSEYHEQICCLKDKLAEAAYSEVSSGLENVDAHELGEVVDMIKDLAEYERNHYQACYYKSVVNAMKRGSERRGYIYPDYDIEGKMPYDDRMRWMGESDKDEYWDDEYGRPYNAYKKAKRHYSESHSDTDKQLMSEHANEHMETMMESIKEMWRDADPQLRQKIRENMNRLTNELM